MSGKSKRVLVTGGAGFIGSHVTRELIRNKHEVIILDDFSTGIRENVPNSVTVIAGSINDLQALAKAFAYLPDSVIHLAAVVSIRNSFDNFYYDSHINISGSLNLLNYAIKEKIQRFVFASSMAVYGPPLRKNENLCETHVCNPPSPYGIAKLTIERYLALLTQHFGMKSTILRYFNTYGNQLGYTPYVGVINIMIKKLLKHEPIEIFGDGTQERDFIHADDVARATVSALDNELSFRVYNVATGKGTSINALARSICEKMRRPFAPIYRPLAPGDIHRAVADVRLAFKELKFKAELTLDSMLESTVAWNIERSEGIAFLKDPPDNHPE